MSRLTPRYGPRGLVLPAITLRNCGSIWLAQLYPVTSAAAALGNIITVMKKGIHCAGHLTKLRLVVKEKKNLASKMLRTSGLATVSVFLTVAACLWLRSGAVTAVPQEQAL